MYRITPNIAKNGTKNLRKSIVWFQGLKNVGLWNRSDSIQMNPNQISNPNQSQWIQACGLIWINFSIRIIPTLDSFVLIQIEDLVRIHHFVRVLIQIYRVPLQNWLLQKLDNYDLRWITKIMKKKYCELLNK